MTSLGDILGEQQERGTFAGVRFSNSTAENLYKFAKDNDIPCPLKPTHLHTTLLFSRKYLPNYQAQGDIDPPYKGTPKSLEVWPTQPDRDGNKKNCLVLRFDCQQLVDRHKFLMDKHQATYDYPDYLPHVSLSYDVGDLDVDKLPNISDYVSELEITQEYKDDLDLDWNVNDNKDDETG